MVSNKMFPLSTSSNNIHGKEALINIDNFEKSTRSSTKHCNSKNSAYYKMFCKMFYFFFTNLSQGNFLYCPKFSTLTKNVNTTHTPTEMKQNLN